jgi:hypothetical protein
MREGSRIVRQDSDVANLHASHQTAQRFTDEIQRVGAGLERYLRYLKEARNSAGADHPLWNCRLGDVVGGERSARGTLSGGQQGRSNGEEKSPRGLSLSNSIEDGSQLLGAVDPSRGGLAATVKPFSASSVMSPSSCSPSSPPPQAPESTITTSPPTGSKASLPDCPSPTPPHLPTSDGRDREDTDDAGGELPMMYEFRPLGHDIDNIMLRTGGRLMSLFPVASVSSNTIVSPPWSESPGSGPSGAHAAAAPTREIGSIEEAIAAVEDIRKSATKVHRCVMDEIYEAKQSVDDLQRRLATLTKSHDLTVQRLMAATTKLQTTATALQNERTALQSVMLKFGASSPLKRGCNGSPTTPVPSMTAANSPDGEDEIDDDELFGSPKRSSAGCGGRSGGSSSPLRLTTVDRTSSGGTPTWNTFGSPGVGGAPWSTIPDEYPNDPRLVSILMLPHDMANDVLRSRRQLRMYIRLISQLPSALQEHHDLLAMSVEEEWLPTVNEMSQELYDEKERLYESARLRLEGEL